MKRRQFTAVEIADIYEKHQKGMSFAEIARRGGLKEGSVSRAIRTLKEYRRGDKGDRHLRSAYVRAVTMIEDPERKPALFPRATREPNGEKEREEAERLASPETRNISTEQRLLEAYEMFSQAFTAYIKERDDEVAKLREVTDTAKLSNWTGALKKRFEG